MVPTLGAAAAAALDADLMGDTCRFSLEQLMELAGLAVAQCAADARPAGRRAVVVCGPGNNGGDGLVAARHLQQFGYEVEVCYPVTGKNPFYQALVAQLRASDIKVVTELDTAAVAAADIVVDAIFGFSFSGAPREPYRSIMGQLVLCQRQSPHPYLLSVDIPSGWHVEDGPAAEPRLVPDGLVSLSAPKACAALLAVEATHYLAGRFIPPCLVAKYNLQMPYAGSAQFVKLPGHIPIPNAPH